MLITALCYAGVSDVADLQVGRWVLLSQLTVRKIYEQVDLRALRSPYYVLLPEAYIIYCIVQSVVQRSVWFALYYFVAVKWPIPE